jgi:dihydrolipoamide dehydrogenase
METAKHDLVVIGAGPGGYVAAIRGAQLGLNVACVELEPVLGGTCLRVGCIPSKALLESSERFAEAKAGLGDHGIELGDVRLDLARMLARKDSVVKALTDGVKYLFKKNKVTRYQGVGRFEAPGVVMVESRDGATRLEAKHVIVATGSSSASLRGVEIDGARIGTSTEALSYPEVPGHLVVIGAGYIGLELGSVWKRLGARVTVLEYLPRILPGMDSELADEARKIFEKQGLEFRLGARVTGARATGEGCRVEVDRAEPID